MLRRLLAGLLVMGLLAGVTVSAFAQDKDKKDKDGAKDKGAPKDKDSKDKGDKAKDKGDKDKGDKGKDKGDKGKDDKGKDDKGKGEKVTIKWSFKKDQVFYQSMKTVTKQSMKVMKNDVSQTQEQTFFFSWKVKSIDEKEGKATLDQKIEAVRMKIDIGGNTIAYDSMAEATANNPLADYFKALVGSEFTVELDTKEWKVTKVEGRDAFLRKLIAANPQMKNLLDTILSENALKEMAEPTFAVVPKDPVAKGGTWDRKTTLDMGPIGKYENTYKYTYVGPEKDLAKISVVTELKYTPPGEGAAQGGLPFKIKKANLQSTSKGGEILFNSKTGLLEKSTVSLTLEGKLTIEIGGADTEVSLSQTQDSVIENIKELPKFGKGGK
jgi:hypothetical protein